MRRLASVLCAMFVLLSAAVASATETLVELSTREGVIQPFLLREAPNPVGVAVLFAGGHGRLGLHREDDAVNLDWGRNNFLVRSRAHFTDQGFHVLLVDAPSDRRGEAGMLDGFRHSAEHMADLAAVLQWVNDRYGLPVWLVGTSRGTESATATALALHMGTWIHGLVLSAPMTRENRRGLSLLEMSLDAIHVPVLLVAHRQDACRSTPPEGVEELEVALVHAPRVQVQWWEGGEAPRGEPCQGLTPHGFLGIEREVVQGMSGFMSANQAR